MIGVSRIHHQLCPFTSRSVKIMHKIVHLLLFIVLVSAQQDLFGQQQQQQQNRHVSSKRNPFGFSQSNPLSWQGQSPRITATNLNDIDWMYVDRRDEEGWLHLYPFGERYYDKDISGRPWNDEQIDLDFFLPYFGFRFNYTFIFPEGFVAFSYPRFIQPPYTFPNPKWPSEPDMSFIAAFMSESTFMHVGQTSISHLFYRIISRPVNFIGQVNRQIWQENQFSQPTSLVDERLRQRFYRGQKLKTTEGRVEDPEFLDSITRDIRTGMVGARGFTANYALLVTWERMGYGGAPKIVSLNQYEEAKTWQNTYQLLLATDEIRTYVIFNYANVNWTSSTSAGSLAGRGGKQSALVGFNGGNGTGFHSLPYSAEGNSYKLVQFGNTQTAGRWLTRIDEQFIYGGCSNDSIGELQSHISYGTMLGGWAVNVSGPCFREGNQIKMQIDELSLDCTKIDMVIARCFIPLNSVYRTGMVDMKLSIDGGRTFPFWKKFYMTLPTVGRQRLRLLDHPIDSDNNWHSVVANNLSMTWTAGNLSVHANSLVDINVYGYWENMDGHRLDKIGFIAKGVPNTGQFSFDPRQIVSTNKQADMWRTFTGGLVQIRISDQTVGGWMSDMGDGLYWSKLVSLGWFWRPEWTRAYGADWALRLCRQWFDDDGRRDNFFMELEPTMSCPCTLAQAVADFGRFTALPQCDGEGDGYCYYAQGASHCVVSTVAVWNGAAQMCCYDTDGWLMFSDDYEYNEHYLRFYSAGVPYRSHPFGAFPYKRPPFVPSLSNWYNDLMPFDMCCKWTAHCEFYFWRRQSSGCQQYRPPVMGFAYGEPHFITYDGVKYTFNGKGYYILSMMKSPRHDFMAQIRMEQPPKTLWNTPVSATVITGLAASDNGSSVVQIFARKMHRRWRYRMDVYVDGSRVYFDKSYKKLQIFAGVTLRSPPRNMNTSIIEVMFHTGVGIRVTEMNGNGMLAIAVALPPSYNESYAYQPLYNFDSDSNYYNDRESTDFDRCADFYRTVGLLGTFNGDVQDDLLSPECRSVNVNYPQSDDEARLVYLRFGERWRIDGAKHALLFQPEHRPLYYPAAFADPQFVPEFNHWRQTNVSFLQSLIFSRNQVRVACQGVPSCEYDYIVSGQKDIALGTLAIEQKFDDLKRNGEAKLISCGPLMKSPGAIKYPHGNNYLDGVTVTFRCKPDYFLHGEQQRTCVNGTWSPGWWVWCRSRSFEIGLKWMTAILTSLAIILVIVLIFTYCIITGRRNRAEKQARFVQSKEMPRNMQIRKPQLTSI